MLLTSGCSIADIDKSYFPLADLKKNHVSCKNKTTSIDLNLKTLELGPNVKQNPSSRQTIPLTKRKTAVCKAHF